MAYRFIQGSVPAGYRYNFSSFLFNREAYRFLQAEEGWLSFYIIDDANSTVEAQIHFFTNEIALSVLRAPFGGVEWSDSIIYEYLRDFFDFVIAGLQKQNVKQIVICHPPNSYQPRKLALIESVLVSRGFEARSEVTSVIHISDKSFLETIHRGKKWMLEKTLQHNFQFQQLPLTAVEQVYNFIAHHRELKRYHLSISLDHLKRSFSLLPESYYLFGVFLQDRLVAASVTVRVSESILYHFISDHIRKINTARPSLCLMNGIYNFCQKERLAILDLGTSMSGDGPNVTLLKFKSELGGEHSKKFTFTKALA